jgi:hypothetical protein
MIISLWGAFCPVLILKTDLVECRSMFRTNYISLREVTRCYCKKDRFLKTLFDEPTKRKLFPDRCREQIFTRLLDRYAENIVEPA